MSDGVPLPAALSGNTVERLIVIDEALLYLVNGALAWLVDRERFEETGALTVETAKTALSDMLWAYFTETPAMAAIGGIQAFGGASAPDKWLLCNGAAISRADYAELFTVIGTAYGVGNGTTTFNLPDLRDRSPYGVGGASVPALGNTAGATAVALSINNLPSHDHDYNDPGHTHPPLSPNTSFLGQRAGAANVAPAGAGVGVAATTGSSLTGITFHAQGSNIPHNNLHPVLGVNFIIYAGV